MKVLLADEMDERAEALGDFLDQMLAGNWRAATVGQALQAVEQAAGIVVFLRDDAALRAAVASVERRIEIAFDFQHPVAVERDEDGAKGAAIAADESALFHSRFSSAFCQFSSDRWRKKFETSRKRAKWLEIVGNTAQRATGRMLYRRAS
ncbi:MAG: hypothetical protein WCE20_00455 [Rhizomicrobium sp.]